MINLSSPNSQQLQFISFNLKQSTDNLLKDISMATFQIMYKNTWLYTSKNTQLQTSVQESPKIVSQSNNLYIYLPPFVL